MREEPKEYSLAELLDHPGLGLVMASVGIERRCLELMLDQCRRERRCAAETQADEPLVASAHALG